MFGGVFGETNEKKVNENLMFLPMGKDVDHKWL